MLLKTKTIIKTDAGGDFPLRYRFFYPQAEDKGRQAKRINAFLNGIFSDYIKKITSGDEKIYTYYECTYSANEYAGGLTVFFEFEKRGEGVYSYRPFSVTFNRSGRAVPLFARIPQKLYKDAKKAFAARGLRLSKNAFRYSYRPDGDGAVIFLPAAGTSCRSRRALVQFRIERVK